MNLVDLVNKNYESKNIANFAPFKAGDTVSVSVRITEGNKSRIQKFDGIVVAMKGNRNSTDGHFRVRKISSGYGVERIFPFHSPSVEAVTVLNVGKVRRAKHFYLRNRTGKSAKIDTDYANSK